MEARALRLPMLSIALSLSVSFCARADICFDTMSGGQSRAYIVHMDADDNTVEVEITGNVQVKSLRPAGESAASGIPRDKLLIRIPEIKLNFAENPHAEYHDFFETMEEAIGLSGQHDGFLNTKIQRAGSSIRIDSEEYTDYSTSGSFETVFINNREFRIEDEKNCQPIRFIVPDPPEIYLYYKQEEALGEQYIFSGLPDEFLLHDIYLGAYAVHRDHPERREQMMERLLRLRYQDLYYQIRYALHDSAVGGEHLVSDADREPHVSVTAGAPGKHFIRAQKRAGIRRGDSRTLCLRRMEADRARCRGGAERTMSIGRKRTS